MVLGEVPFENSCVRSEVLCREHHMRDTRDNAENDTAHVIVHRTGPSPSYRALSLVPGPLPRTGPSPSYRALSLLPGPLPRTGPSPSYRALSLVPGPLPPTGPSPSYRALSLVPGPLPPTGPSPLAEWPLWLAVYIKHAAISLHKPGSHFGSDHIQTNLNNPTRPCPTESASKLWKDLVR